MKWIAAGTVIISVLLSSVTTWWIVSHKIVARASSGVIQTTGIELIDKQGLVRGAFGLVEVDGHEEPQIILRGTGAKDSVVISLDKLGEGTIYFNSLDKEGKVALGHVWGSDVTDHDRPDPLAFWGVRVLGKNGRSEAFGIGESGGGVSPDH